MPRCVVNLCLASFTRHNVFEAHPRCGMGHSLVPLHGQIIFHGVHTPHLLCPVISGWAFGGFHILAIVGHAAVNSHVRVSVWMCVFISRGKYLGGELLGHTGALCNHLGNGRGAFYKNRFRAEAFCNLAALWSHLQPLARQVTCLSLPQCPHFILRC